MWTAFPPFPLLSLAFSFLVGKPWNKSPVYPWFMQACHHLFCLDPALSIWLGSLLMVLYCLFKLAWPPGWTEGVRTQRCSLHMGGSGLNSCLCGALVKKMISAGKPWHICIKINLSDPTVPFPSDLCSEDIAGMSQGLGLSPGASAWCNKVIIAACN